MPTTSRTIGTTSKQIYSPKPDEVADILIQNLSVNNVYLGNNKGVKTTNGIKFVPTATYQNDHEIEPIHLIADAASSDVRIKLTVRKRVDW